jgi:hypothetical protein
VTLFIVDKISSTIISDKDIAIGLTFEHPDFLAAVHSKEPASRQWHAGVKSKCHIIDVLENVRHKQILLGAHC